MMWTRSELKERAKTAFRRNYWKCVLVALVLMILVDGAGTAGSASRTGSTVSGGNASGFDLDLSPDVLLGDDGISDDSDIIYDDHYDENNSSSAGSFLENLSPAAALFAALGMGILMAILLAALVIQIFVCNPIEVGGCSFFLENTSGTPGAGSLFYAFQCGHYGKIVLTLFLRNLYTVLWGILLVIPGIIKSYEYRMIPYLLADNPEMSRQEAFQLSKEMMDGEKWNAFVLDLSFLGWNILSGLTFGLAGIFWVNPYQYATNAELYLALKPEKSVF